MGSTRLHGVSRGFDQSPSQAFVLAVAAVDWFPTVDTAIVDRFEGLAIFDQSQASHPSFENETTGVHFRNALCGYSGGSVVNAARILELFGFGTYHALREQLEQGGGTAHFTLRRAHAPA